ncbi:MAG: UTP--glucose-1-phosphate uridylyltransferase, partial [Rhodospirillaceae bacterium]|nr:UTP--glucose-1-phosphate uridylyltransferase [Rhodospirillaceae bacterium]
PRIFDKLETTQRGAGNEIQLTDGIASLMMEETVHALAFDGVRYDCGTKLGYLQALVEYGLRDEQIGQVFRKYLDEQVQPTR